MDFSSCPLTYILIFANLFVSYKGFNDGVFMDKNMFRVGSILKNREYRRLITSSFLHSNWIHLLFNMYALYVFGETVEMVFGSLFFGIVYFASLIGGDLLSLFIRRKESSYSAIGASGAVSGIVFASIVLFPGMKIGFLLLPVDIPSWVYAIFYTLYTIYGVQSRSDNVGHDAHLGGAIVGTLVCIGFHPYVLEQSPMIISFILLPTAIFLFILTRMPHLLDPSISKKRKPAFNSDDHYNQIRAEKQKEMDRILDKINKEGMESLSDYEKRFLNMNK